MAIVTVGMEPLACVFYQGSQEKACNSNRLWFRHPHLFCSMSNGLASKGDQTIQRHPFWDAMAAPLNPGWIYICQQLDKDGEALVVG